MSGFAQLATYIALLNSKDPGWIAGTEYRPPPNGIVAGSPVVFRGPDAGLIVYGRFPIHELVAVALAALAAQMTVIMAQITLQLSLRVAF